MPLSHDVESIPGYNVLAGANLGGELGLLHFPLQNPVIPLNSFGYVIGDDVTRNFLPVGHHFDARDFNTNTGGRWRDAVLKEVAKLIRGTLRDEDILGRTGGEEFAAVIVESEGNDAFEVARRVCTTVAHAVIAPPGAGNIQVTVSIGPAQLGMRVIDFDNLLNEADRAMYKAKQAGGNRVTVA